MVIILLILGKMLFLQDQFSVFQLCIHRGASSARKYVRMQELVKM
jgi:hypothetical protein